MSTLLPWPFRKIVAHRGAGTMGPENTLAGFRVGLEHGYHAFETDAMLSKDGIPVIMHDPKFGRIIRDSRSVPELTAAEIRQLDAGSWYSPFYAGEPPAGFEQAVRWCRANQVWLNIEIKPAPGFERETGEVVAHLTTELYSDLVKAGGGKAEGIVPEVPLFSSFKPDALRGAYAAAPDIPRGFLVNEFPDNWREILEETDCVALHCNHKRLTQELIDEVHAMGRWVFCYTVNDPKRVQEILRVGVDGLCTDRLDLVHPIA